MISSDDIGLLTRQLTSRFVGLLWSETDMRKLIGWLGWDGPANPAARRGR
ncbi:hypothetical protein ACFWDI_37245 [Streptomyces sp. NPDC060064]